MARPVRSGPARLLAAGAALAFLAAACGDDGGDDGSDGGGTDATSGAEETPGADESAFPVTIEHRFGTTEIEAEPERVVTVGLTDQDALLALGVAPVGTTEWYGEHPGALWPWAQEARDDVAPDAEPEVVGNAEDLNYEAIAAQTPDVILALYAGLTDEQYEQLSAIAPTVAAGEDDADYGISWQDQTRTIGEVTGRTDEAEAVIADIDGLVADLGDEHPELDGASIVWATAQDGTLTVYSPEIAILQALGDLGMEVPDRIGELAGDESFVTVSHEEMEILDVDALVWLDVPEGEGPRGEPTFESLDVGPEGREINMPADDELGGASFISPLSLPYILEDLVPRLAAAVDGDPETSV